MKGNFNSAFNSTVMNRRGFLKSSGALGLSMVVGFSGKGKLAVAAASAHSTCLLYTSPSPRD